MESPNVPEGYQQLMPYLIVKNASGFIDFVVQVFGGEEKLRHMRDGVTVMHAEVTIGSCIIMLADSTGQTSERTGGFFIYVPDADDTYKRALDAGAAAVTAMSDQEYGRSGGVKDAFGNTWWITTAVNHNS